MQLRNALNSNFEINLNTYPIFDESYREILNKKITDYYYFFEIEHETFAMFNHQLGVKMENIMVKYNFLYKQQLKMLKEIDLEVIETFKATNTENSKNELDATGNSESKSVGENLNRYSQTPMGEIKNLDKYLTQASRDNDENKSTSKNDSKSTSLSDRGGESEYTKKTLDPFRAYEVMEKIRINFINIDLEIIYELDELFFKVM